MDQLREKLSLHQLQQKQKQKQRQSMGSSNASRPFLSRVSSFSSGSSSSTSSINNSPPSSASVNYQKPLQSASQSQPSITLTSISDLSSLCFSLATSSSASLVRTLSTRSSRAHRHHHSDSISTMDSSTQLFASSPNNSSVDDHVQLDGGELCITSAALKDIPVITGEKLEQLIVSNCQLTTIPQSLFPAFSQNLRILSLADNKLRGSDLDVVLRRCPLIERLYLSGNFLRYLPPALFNLKHLSTLSVATNYIHVVPVDISKLTGSLRHLNIARNRISMLPEMAIERLGLQSLDISDNPIPLPLQLTYSQQLHIPMMTLTHFESEWPQSLDDVCDIPPSPIIAPQVLDVRESLPSGADPNVFDEFDIDTILNSAPPPPPSIVFHH